jgi:leader peptidase (prepilin peptidase)/N-methyltransferase
MMLTLPEAGAFTLVALVSGLAGGGVVNVLADMLPRDHREWKAGECPKCAAPLPIWRYVPVLGWFRLHGRCPACGERLPRRHFWVDLLAPAALLLVLWRVTTDVSSILPVGVLFSIYGVVSLALLLIFVVDLEHHLILDVVTYPAVGGLLALGLAVNHRVLFFMVIGALIAGGLFGCCYVVAYLIYQTDALGLGDVKLAVLVGLLIGWPQIINALFYGCLAGAATGMVLLIARRADRQTMIPLGTGLSLGAFLALLMGPLLW